MTKIKLTDQFLAKLMLTAVKQKVPTFTMPEKYTDDPCIVAKYVLAAKPHIKIIKSGNIKPAHYKNFCLQFIQNKGRVKFPVSKTIIPSDVFFEIPEQIIKKTLETLPKQTKKHKVTTHIYHAARHLPPTENTYSPNNAKKLYQSDEWRYIRYKVLRKLIICFSIFLFSLNVWLFS